MKMQIKSIAKNKRRSRFSLTARLLLLLSCAISFPLFSSAQDNTGIGYHGAAFLRVNPAARQVAMGDANTALADDINSMRYNVGGLGNLRKIMLAANYHKWIEDTQQGSIALALPSKWGVFGFDFSYFNEGKITELDVAFQPTGGSSYSNDFMLTFGYGVYVKILNNDFGFGGSLKLLRQNLVGLQSTDYAIDLGSQLRLKNLSFGATIQNFGLTRPKFDGQAATLPETYRLGAAARLPIGEALKLNLAGDAAWTTHEKLRYYAGSEIILSDLIIVRGGYKIHKVEPSRWSMGLGLNIPMEWLAGSQTRLDYAYSPLDDFETTAHRFSMLFTFGVTQPVYALNVPDRSGLDEMSERLKRELEAAEKARLAAQQAEERTRQMEEEIARRLEHIKKIAAESQGKIEVEPKTREKILVSMRINFDFDKANIRTDEYPTMHRVAEILNTYPEAQVHISGHTDWIGPDEYNIGLSQRRIDSVMVFLIRKDNVPADKFYMPVGYGEMRPIATNETDEGRFRNRRVEFLLYTLDSVPEMPDGTAVKSVEVVDTSTVRVVCNGKVKFTTKTLDDPYRLLIDMPNVFLLDGTTAFELNRGPFVRARVGYHPDGKFTRTVLDLTGPVDLDVQAVDNYVVVKVK